MKILVTGGAGFIASNVADEFIAQGHDVVIVDDLSTGKKENINPKAKFYQLDIQSPKIEDLFKAGIRDPLKMIKNGLMFASSAAGVILLSECLIGEAPEEKN